MLVTSRTDVRRTNCLFLAGESTKNLPQVVWRFSHCGSLALRHGVHTTQPRLDCHMYSCTNTLVVVDVLPQSRVQYADLPQFVDQTCQLIASGQPRRGEHLPSVRALAVGLGITPMTVAKAYSLLQRQPYLPTACGSRWLLSSRACVFVGTPTIVALSAAARAYGPWGWPTAFAAWELSALGAVYLGSFGAARIDLDSTCPVEPAS